MQILLLVLAIFFLFFILTKGADYMLTYSKAIALKLGWSPTFVGATIVAFGTSAPEFFISLIAANKGLHNIALGNVVGSNIANIGLCLGIAGLISCINIDEKIFKIKIPSLLFLYFIFYYFLQDGLLSRPEGAFFLFLLVVYLLVMNKNSNTCKAAKLHHKSLAMDFFYFSVNLLVIIITSHFVIQQATILAKLLNVSDKVIGITLIAIGTSLPELITSIVAVIKKEYGLSIGNIIGSNIFNITMILGTVSLIKPINNIAGLLPDTRVMILFLLAFMPVLIRKKLTRWHAFILLSGYISYCIFLFWQ